jgi:uncharacterized protein YvpB
MRIRRIIHWLILISILVLRLFYSHHVEKCNSNEEYNIETIREELNLEQEKFDSMKDNCSELYEAYESSYNELIELKNLLNEQKKLQKKLEMYRTLRSKLTNITQYPTYKSGCEIVSGTILLRMVNPDIDVEDLISYLKVSYFETYNGRLYAMHPRDAFVGNIRSTSGFGIYSKGVAETMNKYFEANGYQWEAKVTDGELFDYLDKGYPVQVWVTMYMVDPYNASSWYVIDENGNYTNEVYTWIANEHSVVVIGYDDSYIYCLDPLKDESVSKYDRNLFLTRWNQLNQMSLVIEDIS